jgi:hypothetical protein
MASCRRNHLSRLPSRQMTFALRIRVLFFFHRFVKKAERMWGMNSYSIFSLKSGTVLFD